MEYQCVLKKRMTAGLVAFSLLLPLVGCSNANNPVNASSPPNNFGAPPQNRGGLSGMSTKQKLVMLAGAAALYYMYKKHVNAQNQPAQVQYYRSKNGGIYYRDANHAPHWVTPPSQGFMVPQNEAMQYQREAQEQGFRAAPPSGAPQY